MATTIINGEIVTSTTEEQEFELTRPYPEPLQDVRITWKSGTVQYGVGEKTTAFTPVITDDSNSLTASGEKEFVSVENGRFNLRLKGSGTVAIHW